MQRALLTVLVLTGATLAPLISASREDLVLDLGGYRLTTVA
jgi:hypothetical protein